MITSIIHFLKNTCVSVKMYVEIEGNLMGACGLMRSQFNHFVKNKISFKDMKYEIKIQTS